MWKEIFTCVCERDIKKENIPEVSLIIVHEAIRRITVGWNGEGETDLFEACSKEMHLFQLGDIWDDGVTYVKKLNC